MIITTDLLFDAKNFDMCWIRNKTKDFVPPPPKDISNDFRFNILKEEHA